MITTKTKLFSQNAKMRKTNAVHGVSLYNFGIPAFMSSTGLKTCPNAGSCAKGCYARSGTYGFSNVKTAYEYRFGVTLREDAAVIIGRELEQLETKAKRQSKRLVIRVHDSGDFYNANYQLIWYAIARAFPDVLFYAYTKQIVQSVALSSRQPLNFTLIYSQGGKQDRYIQQTDRHARVFESSQQLLDAGYVDGTNDDLVAPLSSNHRIGLVYHGAKSYRNTSWDLTVSP
jgi:hypothetical protein